VKKPGRPPREKPPKGARLHGWKLGGSIPPGAVSSQALGCGGQRLGSSAEANLDGPDMGVRASAGPIKAPELAYLLRSFIKLSSPPPPSVINVSLSQSPPWPLVAYISPRRRE